MSIKNYFVAVVLLFLLTTGFGCGKKKRCGDCPKFSVIEVFEHQQQV